LCNIILLYLLNEHEYHSLHIWIIIRETLGVLTKKCNDDTRAFFTEIVRNQFIFQNSNIAKNENIKSYGLERISER